MPATLLDQAIIIIIIIISVIVKKVHAVHSNKAAGLSQNMPTTQAFTSTVS